MNVEEIKAYKCTVCGCAYKDKQFAEKCCEPKHCLECGKELSKNYMYTLCEKCREKKDKERETARFENAKHVTLDDADKSKTQMLFNELYKCNNGYFDEIEELIDYCEYYNLEIPKYCYGTKSYMISINAEDIVESACEELHEDAIDDICREDMNELQEFLDKWCEKQTGTTTYMVDYDYAILIEQEA
jgi:hypothetical protein